MKQIPLILGGHSFLEQLGNEPALDEAGQCQLVEACLNRGIGWFDTTYQPERLALGRALKALGRRNEATIIAWNFFRNFGPGQDLGGPEAYAPHHIDRMLEQLQTDRIDCLVVHPVGSPQINRQQEEVALGWKQRGLVRRLGQWRLGPEDIARDGRAAHYDFMVHPRSLICNPETDAAFRTGKQRGWETFACSPFERGWELDRLVAKVVVRDRLPAAQARSRLADHMLRYSLFGPDVDRLIVAVRKIDWISANLASAAKGPLTPSERQWLQDAYG